jgi:hypothetical protein
VATIWCTGFESRIAIPGTAPVPNIRHFESTVGVVPTIQNTVARTPGTWAARWNLVGQDGYLRRDPDVATLVARFYVYFDGGLPSASTRICTMTVPAGSYGHIWFRSGTNDLIAAIGTVVTGATAQAVVANTWYRVDVRFAVGTDAHTLTWQAGPADGSVTPKGAVTQNGFGATLVNDFRFGGSTFGDLVTAAVVLDDILLADASVDYPLGESRIAGRRVVADGVHSFNAAGDLKYDNLTNVPTNATDIWTYLDDASLDSVADFISLVTLATGEYFEVLPGAMPEAASVRCVEVIGAYHAVGINPNKVSARLIDGGSSLDLWNDLDVSNTGIQFPSKHIAAPPSGGSWTKAKFDGHKIRQGSSWTAADTSDIPHVDGFGYEIDYVPSVGVLLPATTILGVGSLSGVLSSVAASPASSLLSRLKIVPGVKVHKDLDW